MNVLITGSSGLIGNQLVSYLVQKNINVIGYDINPSNLVLPQYTYEQGSLEDFPRMASVVKEHKIDKIIHGGGISHPKIGDQSPNQVVHTNIVGTSNIFEVARLFDVKKVVYLSSGAVYGKNKLNPLHENEKPTPTSFYGVSKLTGEYLAQTFTKKYDLGVTSLRLAFVYGPGRNMPDPIKELIEKSKYNESVNENKGMAQKLEFIYVKDAINAIWLALETEGIDGEIFNIGTGRLTSMPEIITIIQELYPHVSIKLGPGNMGYDEMGSFDCTKAMEILKFKPMYTLRQGISDYANLI